MSKKRALPVIVPKAQAGHAVDIMKNSDFYQIFSQYHDIVRKFIRMTIRNEWFADDLTQETFIKAHKGYQALEDVHKMRSWLLRIAYNVCLDHFKADSRHKLDPLETVVDILPANILPIGKQLERNEMSECVQAKMLLLPQSYRTILGLADIAGLSMNEIATVLNTSEGNAKVRVHRARKKLKDILFEHCSFARDERSILVCSPK